MSNPERVPRPLSPDSELFQLLKAYANEDWNWAARPWPAPAEAYLGDASQAEARALADELAAFMALSLNHAGWRAVLDHAHVDWAAFSPEGDLRAWAADLRRRALAAAARP